MQVTLFLGEGGGMKTSRYKSSTVQVTVIIPLNSTIKLAFVQLEMKVFREAGIEFLHY